MSSVYQPPLGTSVPFDFTTPSTPYTPPPGSAVPFTWNNSIELDVVFYDGATFEADETSPGANLQATFYEGSEDATELNPWQFQIYDGSNMVWDLAIHAATPITPAGTFITNYEGSSATSGFTRFVYIPFVLQTGVFEMDWQFSTRPIATFAPTFYEGTEFDFLSLRTQMDLTGDAPAVNYDGAEFDFLGITTKPSSPLIPTGQFLVYGEGATAVSSMQTRAGLPFIIQSGLPAWTAVPLTTCEGCNALTTTFYEGSTFIPNVIITETFAANWYDGTEQDVILATRPFFQINGIFYEGSEAYSTLATQVDLTDDGPLLNSDGSTMVWDLVQNLPWEPTFVFYAGETSLINALSTKIRLVDVFYAGEALVVNFATNPPFEPGAVFSDGATAVLHTIAAQQSLPVLIAYEGTFLAPFSIGNIPNWYIYEGSEMLSNLATQVDLTADGPLKNVDGSSMNQNVLFKPAQPIANQFPFFAGEHASSTLTIAPAVHLSAVFWGSASGFQVDFSNQTHHIDLARQCAVNQPDNYFYWKDPTVAWDALTDGGVQAIPGALATGFNTYMQVTLAVHEHLNPKPMYQGDTFGIYDFWPLLASTGEMGFGMTVLDLKFDLDIPLCYGNFIPDGNHVDAELSTIDDTSCSVDQAYDGTHMSVHMENNIQFAPRMASGEQTASTLTTFTGWFFQFWGSESMHVASNVEFSTTFYEGEFLTIAFAPLTVTFYDGATMTLPTFTTDYTVEFLEVGCLQNEFVDGELVVNPFGAPPTANIELRPYIHQIQAECF